MLLLRTESLWGLLSWQKDLGKIFYFLWGELAGHQTWLHRSGLGGADRGSTLDSWFCAVQAGGRGCREAGQSQGCPGSHFCANIFLQNQAQIVGKWPLAWISTRVRREAHPVPVGAALCLSSPSFLFCLKFCTFASGQALMILSWGC